MDHYSMMHVEQTQILTRGELALVLAYGKQQAKRSANAWRNLVIVRLACCCGLRVSEIAALQLDSVVVGVGRPHLRLRCGTKGGRTRLVPLWWDAGTLSDLTDWKAEPNCGSTRQRKTESGGSFQVLASRRCRDCVIWRVRSRRWVRNDEGGDATPMSLRARAQRSSQKVEGVLGRRDEAQFHRSHPVGT
jgi:integrase